MVEYDPAAERESRDERAQGDSLRERVTARGEETLGRIAQDLLDNPWINSALTAAFDARGKAAQAQELAMDLLNLPSAAHIERLTRRVRAISQRLEGLEDAINRLEDAMAGAPASLAGRLDSIEQQLDELASAVRSLAQRREDSVSAVSPGQERLRVEGPPPPAGPSAAA